MSKKTELDKLFNEMYSSFNKVKQIENEPELINDLVDVDFFEGDKKEIHTNHFVEPKVWGEQHQENKVEVQMEPEFIPINEPMIDISEPNISEEQKELSEDFMLYETKEEVTHPEPEKISDKPEIEVVETVVEDIDKEILPESVEEQPVEMVEEKPKGFFAKFKKKEEPKVEELEKETSEEPELISTNEIGKQNIKVEETNDEFEKVLEDQKIKLGLENSYSDMKIEDGFEGVEQTISPEVVQSVEDTLDIINEDPQTEEEKREINFKVVPISELETIAQDEKDTSVEEPETGVIKSDLSVKPVEEEKEGKKRKFINIFLDIVIVALTCAVGYLVYKTYFM